MAVDEMYNCKKYSNDSFKLSHPGVHNFCEINNLNVINVKVRQRGITSSGVAGDSFLNVAQAASVFGGEILVGFIMLKELTETFASEIDAQKVVNAAASLPYDWVHTRKLTEVDVLLGHAVWLTPEGTAVCVTKDAYSDHVLGDKKSYAFIPWKKVTPGKGIASLILSRDKSEYEIFVSKLDQKRNWESLFENVIGGGMGGAPKITLPNAYIAMDHRFCTIIKKGAHHPKIVEKNLRAYLNFDLFRGESDENIRKRVVHFILNLRGTSMANKLNIDEIVNRKVLPPMPSASQAKLAKNAAQIMGVFAASISTPIIDQDARDLELARLVMPQPGGKTMWSVAAIRGTKKHIDDSFKKNPNSTLTEILRALYGDGRGDYLGAIAAKRAVLRAAKRARQRRRSH